MKLYLSSYLVPTPEELFDLFGKQPREIKVALIPNAKDYYAEPARSVELDNSIEELKVIGIADIDTVDLRELNSRSEVKAALKGYDMLWVIGGNTFCLRYEMKRSGFDICIKELLDGGLVWAGYSAGAIVAGPTLKGVEHGDVPDFAKETIYEGLGLIDEIIMPHADGRDFDDMLVVMRKLYTDNPDYIELNDADAYVIDGDRKRKVSSAL